MQCSKTHSLDDLVNGVEQVFQDTQGRAHDQ